MNAKVQAGGKKFRQPGDVNALEPLLIMVVFIVVVGYSIIALSTKNPMWFLPNDFTARPDHIEVYHEGERRILSPGSADYEALTAELSEQISHMAGYDEIRMSPRTIENAFGEYTTVVMVYSDPIRINTQWSLGEPDRILIPVTGTNSGENKIYTGTGERYGHGGLILEDLSGFYALVQEMEGR